MSPGAVSVNVSHVFVDVVSTSPPQQKSLFIVLIFVICPQTQQTDVTLMLLLSKSHDVKHFYNLRVSDPAFCSALLPQWVHSAFLFLKTLIHDCFFCRLMLFIVCTSGKAKISWPQKHLFHLFLNFKPLSLQTLWAVRDILHTCR